MFCAKNFHKDCHALLLLSIMNSPNKKLMEVYKAPCIFIKGTKMLFEDTCNCIKFKKKT
jgi:hypothetical protein